MRGLYLSTVKQEKQAKVGVVTPDLYEMIGSKAGNPPRLCRVTRAIGRPLGTGNSGYRGKVSHQVRQNLLNVGDKPHEGIH